MSALFTAKNPMTKLTLAKPLPRADSQPQHSPQPQSLPPAEPATIAAITALMLRRTRLKSGTQTPSWTQPAAQGPRSRE